MTVLDDNNNFMVDEKSVSIWNNVKKWALISALVGIVSQLAAQMLGVMSKGFGTLALFLLISLGISIAIYIYALREHRDQELGGYMSFKRAFTVAFMIALVSSVIALIFNYIYLNFLNPSALDAQLESARAMMEKFNMPEDQLEAAMEKQKASMSSPISIVTGLLGAAFFGAILSLIAAAIMKKERPMFK